ncbi:amino acid ABC transporter permease [Sneathiella chinensis]|uniref:Amino acid ABC transporter permease n=1 Tax=Sneathiella chinensis TaxID=349750 RepID=A0ABQ5U139_9PROT|nr:amino acid ABC transporter permease [Sneathiella chinensis]GLQ05151.1 amino acid ABC transporter permease [Sneathiella chinensis]
MTIIFQPSPDQPAPPTQRGVIKWLRDHFFSSVKNTILTFLGVGIILAIIPPLLDWFVLNATFVGNADECRAAGGACWSFVQAQFRLFMIGSYPQELAWRPIAAGLLLLALFIATARQLMPGKVAVVFWLLLPLPIYWLVGGGFGLESVDTSKWGGLLLTLVLSVVGILVSVPLGILLALGRRSNIKLIKGLCIALIETVRGVPLVTILFMASIMLPLFLPSGMEIGILYRVQIGIILFSSAYIAEVVRGGLQGVESGQSEAAASLGLHPWVTMLFIILPQALTKVLPPLIGRCIALLKDTSLVIVVGLLDFLGISKAASQDPEWLGFDAEAFVFCALIYWILCFGLSRYGNSLEKRGYAAYR